MSHTLKNVIIIGAGGNLGAFLVNAVDSEESLNLSILSRESSKSTFPSHVKVHTVPDSYPKEAIIAAFTGQDVVIDLAPLYNIDQHNIDQHKAFIDAAIKAGVKRFFGPEFGANSMDPRIVEAVPLFQGKKNITEYLISKETEGLTWTGVLNGNFFDWAIKNQFLGFDLTAHTALIYDDGTAEADFTLLSDIAKAVVAVILHPSETANRYVNVNTFFTSQNAILTALQEATGGEEEEKWTVHHVSAKQANEEGNARVAKGDYSGAVSAIMGLHMGGHEWAHQRGSDNKLLLGRGTRSEKELKDVVAKIVKGEDV